MPTYENFQQIEGRLTSVESTVTNIQGSINDINSSLSDLSSRLADVETNQGNYLTSADFEAWKDGARFVKNVQKDGDNWTFEVADGNGDLLPDASITLAENHPVSVYEKDDALYWVINGDKTNYPVESKPYFKIDNAGRLQFSFDNQKWTTLESASVAVKVILTADEDPTDGVYSECENAEDALWAGIYYSENNIVWMPTYKNFSNLESTVTKLTTSINGINTLLDELTFISELEVANDANGIPYLKYTPITIDDNTATPDESEKLYLTGIVIPADNDVYKVFTGYNADNEPQYAEFSLNHVPICGIYNDKLYISINENADPLKIGEQINMGYWVEVYQSPAEDANNFGKVDKVHLDPDDENSAIIGYNIYFPNPANPGGYLDPIFVNNYQYSPTISLTPETATGKTNVTITVIGSFASEPNIIANCEGNWTSTAVVIDEKTTYPTNKVTATVVVSPTTAYVGDKTKGKLTIYVPYFGKTAVGQISLSANESGGVSLNGAIRGMQILDKAASDTTATVTFILEGEETTSPFNGSCTVVFDYDYTLQEEQTIEGYKVETGNGFSGKTGGSGWLGAGACKYDSSTNTFEQEIDIAINTNTKSSRTGAVIVYSPSGREVTRFIIRQNKLESESDNPTVNGITINKLVPENGDAANCYIITKPGRYELPAYSGAIKKNLLSNSDKFKGKPDVVWNDNETKNKIHFFQGHLADDKIIIDINPQWDSKGNVTGHGTSISNGNALVSIKDDTGEILWSWHLWFCEPAEDPRLDENTDKYPERTNVNVMNRALGATNRSDVGISSYKVEYWKDGLFYQSGRKDPIRLNSNGTAAYDELPENSAVEFDKNWSSNGWTESKSPSDPCPPGYKVPTIGIWRDEPNNGIMENLSTVALTDVYPYNIVSTQLLESILYPYCGYLGDNGILNKTQTNTTTNDIYGDGPAEKTILQTMFTTINGPTHKTQPTTPAILVSSIKYNISDIHFLGYLKANSDDILEYEYTKEGYSIVSYTYQECEWKRNIIGRYSPNYNNVKNTYVLNKEQIKNYLTATQISALDALIATDNLSVLKIGTDHQKKDFISTAAFYVRCVKELPTE